MKEIALFAQLSLAILRWKRSDYLFSFPRHYMFSFNWNNHCWRERTELFMMHIRKRSGWRDGIESLFINKQLSLSSKKYFLTNKYLGHILNWYLGWRHAPCKMDPVLQHSKFCELKVTKRRRKKWRKCFECFVSKLWKLFKVKKFSGI